MCSDVPGRIRPVQKSAIMCRESGFLSLYLRDMTAIEIIGTVIAAVATVLTGVWFIVRKAQEHAVNGYRLGNVEKDVAGLKADMSEVRSDIFAIKTVLVKKFPNATEVFSMKKSPRVLNGLGERVFSEIHGKEFLESNRDLFFGRIDSKRPKTALDVEMYANLACSELTDSDIFNDIKSYVYNAPSLSIPDGDGGSRRYDLALSDICYILSLPLRDMYLDAHPEIQR